MFTGPGHITPFSRHGLAGALTIRSGQSTIAWPASNRAEFYPIRLDDPQTILRLWVFNGGTISGNLDIGVYAADFTRLVSTGSTAHAGANASQAVTVSAVLGPGLFYIALAFDNTTATVVYTTLSGPAAVGLAAAGCAEQSTAFPLPAVATPVRITTAVIPLFGASTQTTI